MRLTAVERFGGATMPSCVPFREAAPVAYDSELSPAGPLRAAALSHPPTLPDRQRLT